MNRFMVAPCPIESGNKIDKIGADSFTCARDKYHAIDLISEQNVREKNKKIRHYHYSSLYQEEMDSRD